MSSKKIFLGLINKILNVAGYKFILYKKNRSNIVTIDKNYWTPFAQSKKNKKMELYYEGLRHSENEKSDNELKQLRFYSLQQLVHYVLEKKIAGDFVECGVWKGHSAYLISKIISKSGLKKRLYIFDSFEGGLSKKVEKDLSSIFKLTQKEHEEQSKFFASLEIEVRRCLKDFNFVSLYKGWIPEQFYQVDKETFSFVHIDVDLYEPTLDTLKFFFPKLSKGGVIVCDDYNFHNFPGAKKAFDEFFEDNKCHMFYEVPMGGCFIIK